MAALARYEQWIKRQHPCSSPKTGNNVLVSDLFCGPGGFSYGIRAGLEDGGHVALSNIAVDFDAAAIETYRANNSPIAVRRADLKGCFNYSLADSELLLRRKERPSVIDKKLLAHLRRTHVLVASPPCRGFSNLNNVSRRNDDRNELTLAAAGLAICGEVPTFVMENVPEIRSDKGRILERAISVLRAHEYSVDIDVLNAANFGIPQSRRRLLLIASKVVSPEAVFERLSAMKVAHPPVVEVLALANQSERPYMVAETNLSSENKKRVNYLFDHDIYDLPNEVRPECHQEEHTYPSVYGRIKPDTPAQTLTSGFLSPGRGRYVHPTKRRGLNLRDGARIQSFPDAYVFPESHGRTISARMIGDAVPPLLSYWLGRALACDL
jgi:DNA (cytosine-5)-methyltransferase 1